MAEAAGKKKPTMTKVTARAIPVKTTRAASKTTAKTTNSPPPNAKAAPTKTRVVFYPTYSLNNGHDPVIDTLQEIVNRTGAELSDLSDSSRVARSTMKNWFTGKTISPRHVTLAAVASALGYEYRLVKRKR